MIEDEKRKLVTSRPSSKKCKTASKTTQNTKDKTSIVNISMKRTRAVPQGNKQKKPPLVIRKPIWFLANVLRYVRYMLSQIRLSSVCR